MKKSRVQLTRLFLLVEVRKLYAKTKSHITKRRSPIQSAIFFANNIYEKRKGK